MTYRGYEFNGDNGNCSGGKYWCNFVASNWWKADRLLILMQATSATPDLEFCVQTPVGVIKYQEDVNRMCIIDITDIVRTYPPQTVGNYIQVLYGQGTEQAQDWTLILSTAAKGLINPAREIIPAHALQSEGVVIVPPDVMISSASFAYGVPDFEALQFEFRASDAWDIKEYANGEIEDTSAITQPAHTLDDATIENFVIVKDAELQTSPSHAINLQPQECGKEYIMIEWESFTGAIRKHVFEVLKSKITTANGYDLLNVANEYTTIKGREESLTLHLEGLSAYDLWYYSDMINSSFVIATRPDGIRKRVQVTDKSFVTPDGDNFNGELNITINWKRYDAVTLQ